jgi:hypothetical protein
MKTSPEINEIAAALNMLQGEVHDVFKGADGYGYKYATLDKVYDEVRPLMSKHGLSLTHQKEYDRANNQIRLHSMLMHTSGQFIAYEASFPFASLKGMNDYQSAGSGFTYLERYQTSAIFAITSDMDNDAAGAQEAAKITDAQGEMIIDKANEVGADMDKFLKWLKVGSVSEINASDFTKVMTALNKKAKK